jgi:hypothetical protein
MLFAVPYVWKKPLCACPHRVGRLARAAAMKQQGSPLDVSSGDTHARSPLDVSSGDTQRYLLGGGPPRPDGCWFDFDLRTDNQAITWLKTNRHLNKMYVRWVDEIEDFRFDVTHLPGLRNPSDPLSCRGFVDAAAKPAARLGEAA